ncbi:MAG: hypothetical protein OEZ36_08955, partial [Spirochaetota bacterium]|nr:hypothetical protein [Spirochaetota bacterium]
FIVRYLGKAGIKLIMFPTVLYYIIVQKKVRQNALKYWSTIYPKHSKLKHLVHIYKQYATFGETLVDRITDQCIINNTDQDQSILEELHKDRGIILLCSHIGGYNFFRFQFDETIHVMMFNHQDDNKQDKYAMFDHEHKEKVRFINPSDPNAIFKAAKVLSERGILAIMGDRVFNTKDKYLKEKDILGLRRNFPLGPWHIAYSTSSSVLCLFIIKRNKEYHLILKPPIHLGKEINKSKKEQIDEGFMAYVQNIEEVLKDYPYQWFNFKD